MEEDPEKFKKLMDQIAAQKAAAESAPETTTDRVDPKAKGGAKDAKGAAADKKAAAAAPAKGAPQPVVEEEK